MNLTTRNNPIHLRNRQSYFVLLTVIVFAITLHSCAQIRPLTGGKKDTTSPKELKSFPINESTNFNSKKIKVEFDEYIKLDNLSSQLIVSPLMETTPEILVKGKNILIKIKSELNENTTYSLNFGNAVRDITENNAFPNYKYVFSTGTFIDSLAYSGRVVNALDLSPENNTYVLLYDQLEDSIPLKEKPRYIALTDKKGNFSLTNIAQGEYKLFAIKDINNNYIFDLPNEQIGFESKPIKIDSSLTNNTISLFEEANKVQFLKASENKVFGKIDIEFNLPTEELSINPLGYNFKKEWYLKEKSINGDSLTIWLLVKDAFKNLKVELKDGNEIIDTADIKIIQSKNFKDTILGVSSNASGTFDLNKKLQIHLDRPLSKMNAKKIQLLEDSILIPEINIKNKTLTTLELDYIFKANKKYTLFIPPTAFEDIFGLKNDSIITNFKTKKESAYGLINLSIKPSFSKNYIVQLFKNEKLIQEGFYKNSTKIEYPYLLPGNYQIKLIIDQDNNHKWTTGNYLEGMQPEKVIYYKKNIKIKANWDNDISWTINN